ncbi:ribose-phosphate pyrophosphokinase [Crocinitomicaceae bacterium]|nr:ribose-phosphate pyrophosphokinase [Flavobacteriales bacterium]MDA7762002.1 ribose-phosphate pyrophosphokinase [Crocinitomicaceae bacterium]MDA8910581.1 ribose-phosphate pyrophosphokinase [Crocinitomicaceae bacterium]MDB4340109.1 ribose-phosphate pyrophosphokinase [Crocinitomicaceae bacterium]MDC0459263.1 ribose-phosphate pyrophosphokinase [Crocinitomicaceae bacterium]
MGVKIFAGRASQHMAEHVAKAYGTSLGSVKVNVFSDGEFQPSLEETVRGQDVFIVQSTMPPTENLFELLLLIDAAKRASARKIIAVIPYFGFARQDRKDKPRVAIGAKLSANMLMAAGIDRIMTMDLHADQIQGFFEVPVDHLYASTLFLKEIEKMDSQNLVIAAPDVGGAKRANSYSKKLNCGLALCHKNRKKANEIAEMTVIGEVSGKDVVIIDDMCDTAGTLTKAADLLMGKGAKSVRAFCTHAVLSGPAYERINNSKITELIVTDTIPMTQKSDKIRVITAANLFSDVIHKLINNESISGHFVIS